MERAGSRRTPGRACPRVLTGPGPPGERSLEHGQPDESHLRKVYALLVYSLFQTGQKEQALDTCRRGLELFPQDAELRFRLGMLLHDSGKLEQAVQVYQDLLTTEEERHFSSVVQGLRGFKARQNLAVVYQDLGDFARAEEQWRLVVGEVPSYREGWRGLGEILLRQGKHTEAEAVQATLLAVPALHGEGLLLQGQIAAARGDIVEARRTLETAAAEQPEEPAPWRVLGQLLFERSDPAEAEWALKEQLKRDPEDPSAHHNLGTVYQRLGCLSAAVEAYQQSLRYRPDYLPTQVQLGTALEQAGRFREAIATWETVLRLDPHNTQANAALQQARRQPQTLASGADSE